MPLVDQFGHEITPRPRRKARRPKNVPAARRTSPKAIAKGTAILRANQNVEIVLVTRHNINGVPYGPGRVVVPRKIAQVLAEGERRASQADANFASTRACVIGPGPLKGGLRVRQVAPEYFDLPYLPAVPFGVIDKSGNFAAS